MSEVKTQLSLAVLLKQCAKDDNIEKYLNDINHANNEIIHDIFKYQKFNYCFSKNLELRNNGEVIGFIGPSYDEYLKNICLFLNVPVEEKIIDNEELTNKLNVRLLVLNSITTEKELKKEFPYIYQDLMEGRKLMGQITEQEQKHPRTDDFYKEQKHAYYRCGLRRSLNKFITTQTQVYRRFVERRESYKEETQKRNYNHYLKKYFDIDKIAFYAAYSFLEEAKKTTDINEKEAYLKVVKNYLYSNYNKYRSIKINDRNVDLRKLVEDYLTEKYDNYYRLSEVLSTRELIDIVKAQEENNVDWVMIPVGKNPNATRHYINSRYRTILLPEFELENLRKKGQEKEEFYEKTPYLGKIIGLSKYKGYRGYIYPNGEILLDTVYNANKPQSAVGCAIYNLKVEDFETLSKLDKTHLRNNSKVKRIFHSKNWKEKAQQIIDKPGTEEDIEKAKQLIKKYQK